MDVYSSSKWFFVVLRLIGLAPYSVDKKTREFKMKLVNKIILVFSVSIYLILALVQASFSQMGYISTGAESNFLDAIWRKALELQQFLSIAILVFNFSRMENVENFMKVLNKFDQSIDKLGWEKAKQIKTFYFFGLLIASTTMMTIIMTTAFFVVEFESSDRFFEFFVDFFNYIIVTELFLFVSVQFTLSAIAISNRLDSLMNNVRFLMPMNDEFSSCKMDSQGDKIVIQNIAILYDLLADGVDEINSVFSKLMIAVLTPALFLITFTAYFIIKVILFKLPVTLIYFFDFFLWNLFLVVPIFFVIKSAASIVKKCQTLCNYIGKYSNYCTDEIVAQKANNLSNKFNSRPMILSSGFFNIDYGLSLSILGTIATYLVIICQFENDN